MLYSHLSAQAPIAIFDSGIGGLTITKSIEQALPNEQLIYLADSAFAPYGEKSVTFIQQRTNAIADYFMQLNVKAIVIACNTATVNAIDQLRSRINIPIVGVEPAIKPAGQQSKNKNVGILVTLATSKNQRFISLVERYKNGANVYIQACPGLVEAIEKGEVAHKNTDLLLKEYLAPLQAKNIDTLVLGCTHYPMLEKPIKTILGDQVKLLDTAQPVTKQLTKLLSDNYLLNPQPLNVGISPHQWLSTKMINHQKHNTAKNWQLINV